MAGKTKIALVGLPGLIAPLAGAGFTLVTDSTDPTEVVPAVKSADAAGDRVLVIAGPVDDKSLMWLRLRVKSTPPRPVLLLHSAELGGPADVKPSRALELPASVDDIMAVFGAKPRPGGDVVIGASGMPAADDADEDIWMSAFDDDDDDDFDAPAPAPVQVAPAPFDDAPAPVQVAPAPFDDAPAPVQVAPAPFDDAPAPSPFTPAPATIVPSAESLFESPQVASSRPGGLAPAIVVFAAKGGVGKDSSAITLAAEAAERGLKVALVDMNRGQGDLRTYLRLTADTSIPSIYDAAIAKAPLRSLVKPSHITAARSNLLPPVPFGAVFAPPAGQADPAVVTADFYARTIREIRAIPGIDLVIVITQIVEAHDTSELIDKVAAPLMRSPGGWGLALSDSSSAGITNLMNRFSALNLPPERMMVYVNRAEPGSTLDYGMFETLLHQRASFMGVVHADPDIFRTFESGGFPNSVPEMGSVMTNVLARVTGNPVFDPRRYQVPARTGKARGFRLPWKKG